VIPTLVSYRTPNPAKPPPLACRFQKFDERTYARLPRALRTRNLHLIRAAAVELPQVRVDGLTGFPDAIAAVFPRAWVQTCIVHQIRSSMRWVSYNDRKKVAAELRPVYAAVNADAAEQALAAFDDKWGARYPMIAESWRARWDYIVPFLALPADLRRIVYTTNSIENLNRQIRKAIKTRGHFPDEQAATKLIYLAILRAHTAWKTPYRWTSALRALKIHFGDRLPD
jgi:putative transposase